MKQFHLDFDQFVRSVAINENDAFSVFLGAGASITSGILSAGECIWEWKKAIYQSNKPRAEGNLDIKADQVRQLVQAWLDSEQQYPNAGSDEEYSFFCEKCYPIPEDRRAFFERLCVGKTPSVGYKLIGLLNEMGLINSVWTTNFDDLLLDAVKANGGNVIDIPLDATHRVDRPDNKKNLVLVKLHGDYKYGQTKNTDEELQNQDAKFSEALINRLQTKHLIVTGYSGRDLSVMNALKNAYSKPGGGRLFWCGRGQNIPPRVKELMETARANGRTAYYIDTDGFDELFISLTNICTKKDPALHIKYRELIKGATVEEAMSKFSISTPSPNTAIKSNIFEIGFPDEVYQFDIDWASGAKVWQALRSYTQDSNVVAVPHNGNVWALGDLAEINTIFQTRMKGRVTRINISSVNAYKDSSAYSLLLTALLDLMAKKYGLSTDRRRMLWKNKAINNKMIGGVLHFTHEAVQLSLSFDGGKNYLCIQPDFHVSVEVPGTIIGKDAYLQIGKEYFDKMRNKIYSTYLDDWRRMILGNAQNGVVTLYYPENVASPFWFKISSAPSYAGVYNDEKKGQNLPPDFPVKLLTHRGVKYPEPALLFSPRHKGMTQTPKDFHPMRGVSTNHPYDFDSLPASMNDSIRVGVICPQQDSAQFNQFLQRNNSMVSSNGVNAAYLLDFPGFQQAFSSRIHIPQPGGDDWAVCPEPEMAGSIKDAALSLRNNVIAKIEALAANSIKKVLVIFIPDRWLDYSGYDLDNEHYDLHDYIKAYCAERQIATQFIQEKTIKSVLQCQINWWLSLSYFVKSMRTPWVLEALDVDTAFAGIGYSVTKQGDKSDIVLGCSHIYNSQGQGLKYRLSKVEDDLTWDRHKRPHLSYHDAYRLGVSTVRLFYDTMDKFPRRVVIHKRTHFTAEEKNGLRDSLLNAGVKELDLIEVNFEDDIRFLASRVNYGKLEIDGYSVDRGTCVLINGNEALLWTHGVVQSVLSPSQKFYLGGRYIPAPLRIIKHYGNGSLNQIATEILGLTKMNWNSFDLYSQLPATVNSSNEIARIARLLSKKQGITYDYRYFI